MKIVELAYRIMFNINKFTMTAFTKLKTHGLNIRMDDELTLSINDTGVTYHTNSHMPMTSNTDFSYLFCKDKEDISIVNNIVQIGKSLTFTSKIKVNKIISVDCNVKDDNFVNTAILITGTYENTNETTFVDDDCCENNNMIKDISMQTYKFLCIFCSNEMIVNVVNITDNICVDQIPLSIYYPIDSQCIIRGTYGLIAHVLNDNLKTNLVLPLSGHGVSMITSVIYDNFNKLLFSGDYNGGICMWKPNNNHNLYKISIPNSPIDILHIIGERNEVKLYVAICDTLFCLTIFIKDNFHITRCLDMSIIQNVKYFVTCDNELKIFKIHNEANIIVISSWNFKDNYQYNHKRIDFDTNCVHRETRDIFKNVLGKNPITLEENAIMEHVLCSNDNVIIKNKENYYLSSKKMIKDNISNQQVTECDMLKVGIPTKKLKKTEYTAVCGTNHQLFEVDNNNNKIIVMPESTFYHKRVLRTKYEFFKTSFDKFFPDDRFQRLKNFFAVFSACYETPVKCSIIKLFMIDVDKMFQENPCLDCIFVIDDNTIDLNKDYSGLNLWLTDYNRATQKYWIDISEGHNLFTKIHLQYFSNKNCNQSTIANKSYFETYGFNHFTSCSRGLSTLVTDIKKLDETSGLKKIPKQIGFLENLEEIYLRDCNLTGEIPREIGFLSDLRVISLGNNNLKGTIPRDIGNLTKLQRVILHCNDLEGETSFLQNANCIIHLAGNDKMLFDNVPIIERQSLIDLYNAFNGQNWGINKNWCSDLPVSKWYKIGVFNGHVEVMVGSSNNLVGNAFPPSLINLTHIKMIELASMPGITANLTEICRLTSLQRLCICKCGLVGNIPDEIGNLVNLVELQLFGNKMKGQIPSSIGNLTKLTLLSIGEYTGGNEFSDGYIPISFANLINLKSLFLANCNLIGEIPSWICSLVNLKQLDLQCNKLVGCVPCNMSNLTELAYFNIKENKLSGRVPLESLLCCTKLRKLSVVNNNFTNCPEVKQKMPFCEVFT